MTRRGTGGFTLVELLVVLVLLGLITLLSADGLRFGAQVWQRIATVQARGEAPATARAIVRTVLQGAVFQAESGGAADPAAPTVAGDARSVRFRGLPLDAFAATGLVDYELRLVPDGSATALVLRWSPDQASAPGQAAVHQVVLLGDLAGGAFAYRADRMAEGLWRPDWNAQWPAPDLIRLRLTGRDPAPVWPDLVARTLLHHLSACSYVPIELHCNGR